MTSPRKTLPAPPTVQGTMDTWKEYVSCHHSADELAQFCATVTACLPDVHAAHAKLLAWRAEKLATDETFNWAGPQMADFFLGLPFLLPVHTNFPFVFAQDTARSEDLCTRAARVSAGFVAAHDMLVRGTYGVDAIKGQELCMKQCAAFFAATRVPGPEADTFVTHTTPARGDLAVMCRGRVYAVRGVWTHEHGPASASALRGALRAVVAHAEAQNGVGAVGLLTCLDRRPGAVVYEAVRADSDAAAALHVLEHCLFVVCLDTQPLGDADTRGMINQVARAVREGDTRTRWFHKPLQLVFTPTGGGGDSEWHDAVAAGLVVEHSNSDGTSIALLAERALGAADSVTFSTTDDTDALEWAHCPLPMDGAVVAALLGGTPLAEAAGPLFPRETRMFLLDAFGRDACVQRKASPDACFVASVHLCARRMLGRVAKVQHVVSMRAYHDGRGSPNMVGSPLLVRWLDAMCDDAVCGETRATLFREVLAQLAVNVRQTRRGERDPVRHLAALQERAPEAALWTRPELLTLNLPDFLLSGGRVSRGVFMFGSNNWFTDQFSLGYTVHADHVRVYAAVRGAHVAHLDTFEQTLPTAMADVAALL